MQNHDIYLDDTHIHNVERTHEFRYYLESDVSASLSDHHCLRFLRAREGDMIKAVEMAKEWNEWRHTLQSENLKYSANFVLACQSSHLLWNHPHSHLLPCSHHGFDKTGRPVFWIKLGFVVSQFEEVKKYFSNEQLIHFIIWTQEALILRQEYSSQQSHRRIDDVIVIADMKHFPMSSFVDSRALSMMRLLISICQNYYPETLNKLILLNTPWHFSAAFKLFSSLIRPRTLAKIATAKDSDDAFILLSEHLWESDIPTALGGTCVEDVWDSSTPPSTATGLSESQVTEYMRKKIAPSIIDKVLWPEELAAWRTVQLRIRDDETEGEMDILSRLRNSGRLPSSPPRSSRSSKRRATTSSRRGARSTKSSKASLSPLRTGVGSSEFDMATGSSRGRGSDSGSGTEWTVNSSGSGSSTQGKHSSQSGPVLAYRSRSGSLRGVPRMRGSFQSSTVSGMSRLDKSRGSGGVVRCTDCHIREVALPPSLLQSVKTRVIRVEEKEDHHEYVIRVELGGKYTWKVQRRYSDFVRLRSQIVAADTTVGEYPALPPKVLFRKKASSVVTRRVASLATFLVVIIEKCAVVDSVCAAEIEDILMHFLEIDHPTNIEQNETLRASMQTQADDYEERGSAAAALDHGRFRRYRLDVNGRELDMRLSTQDGVACNEGDEESDVTTDDDGFEYSSGSRQSLSALAFAATASQSITLTGYKREMEKSVMIMVVVACVFGLGLTMYKNSFDNLSIFY